MFKYRIIQQSETPDFDGYLEQEVIETKKDSELVEKAKEVGIDIDLEKLKNETMEALEYTREKIKKECYDFPEHMIIDAIYNNSIYRKDLSDDIVVEVEYFPTAELISEIEKETGKEVKLRLGQKIRAGKTDKQLLLKQYSPNIKNYKTIFTYSRNKENSNKVELLLKKLEELFNEYIS